MSELSDFALRALRVLVEHGKGGTLLRPGYFGTLLWPETNRPTWAFARPAGKVLNKLKGHGLAEHVYPRTLDNDGDDWGWRATPKGKTRAAA